MNYLKVSIIPWQFSLKITRKSLNKFSRKIPLAIPSSSSDLPSPALKSCSAVFAASASERWPLGTELWKLRVEATAP